MGHCDSREEWACLACSAFARACATNKLSERVDTLRLQQASWWLIHRTLHLLARYPNKRYSKQINPNQIEGYANAHFGGNSDPWRWPHTASLA